MNVLTRQTFSTLRNRLRAETFPEHQALDDLFTQIDIATRQGFIVFAQAHHAAFQTLSHMHASPDIAAKLRSMTDALFLDLATLQQHPAPFVLPDLETPHPMSIGYIVTGSRMGTAVMRKRWQGSTDPMVLGAGRYLTAPVESRDWRELCSAFDGLPATSRVSDTIVADAKAIFGLFQAAAEAALDLPDVC